MHADQKRIRVTVQADFDDALHIARCRAFVPKLIPAARPEKRFPFFKSKLQGLSIHVRQHQDVAGLRILDNRRDQSTGIEFNFICLHRLYLMIGLNVFAKHPSGARR